MAQRKLGKSWWVDITYEGKRYRKRSPENSKYGAKIYEATLRRRLAEGLSIFGKEKDEKKTQPFQEFVWFWYNTHVLVHNKPGTANRTRTIIMRRLVPVFGKTPLDRITTLDIERFKAARSATGVANKTINNDLGILSKCLNDAKSWLELDRIAEIKLLKLPAQQYEFLTQEECRKLLGVLKQPWFDMVYLALRTGLRLGELRGLHWAEVDLERSMLTVRYSWCAITKQLLPPKGNAIRNVPLPEDVVKILRKRDKIQALVFDTSNGATNGRKFNKALADACMESGVRKITCHALRHSYASHLAMKGVPIITIKELLGHTDIKVTMRYAHLTETSKTGVTEVMSTPLC